MTDLSLFLAPDEREIVVNGDDPWGDLIARGVLERVDWSGEDIAGQIAAFVVRRLVAFGASPGVAEAVAVAARDAVRPGLERGEAVPAVLHAMEGALGSTDLALGELRLGDDAYRIGVMPRTRVSLRAWGLDRRPRELLYIIECPCGTTNVWQLPESDPEPGMGECDACGRALFDDSRVPIVPMGVEAA
jgi:hypothetical protein